MSVLQNFGVAPLLRSPEYRASQLRVVTDSQALSSRTSAELRPSITTTATKIGRVSVGIEIVRSPNRTEQTPFLLVPGYFGDPRAYGTFAHHLAMNGRDVILYGTDRKQKIWKDPLAEQAKAAWAAYKAAQIILGFEQADTAGHSMGNAIGIKVAAKQPGAIRSHNSLGGGGNHHGNQLPRMIYRLGKVAGSEVVPNLTTLLDKSPEGTASAEVLHVGRNIPQILREGVAIALEDSRPDFEQAKENGVRTDAYLYDEDGFWTPRAILEHSGHLFDSYHVIPNATHCYPLLQPERHAQDLVAGSFALNYNIPQLEVAGAS